ncbi:MAG: hypothetical protein AB4063_05505 [Crocosphaera sp.]
MGTIERLFKTTKQENASSVVQVALKYKLRSQDGKKLLELAGIIESAPVSAMKRLVLNSGSLQ